jgi:hypothetical protein
MERKQKNFKVRRDLAAAFGRICEILCLDEYEAAELALQDWVKKHHDEAQKKLDLYAEKGGVPINEPEHVEIKVFQRVDIFLAKEELTKRINNLDRGTPEYHKELHLELAESIHKLRPVCVQTRDPELLQLIQNAEKRLRNL